MNEDVARTTWWQQHRSLTTIAIAGATLLGGALVLAVHILISSSQDAGPHIGPDLLFFGVHALVIVFAAGTIVKRQLRSDRNIREG